MAYFLMGYDVESYLGTDGSVDPQVTLNFLKQARKVHQELKAPCTLFVCGRLLEDPHILEALQGLSEPKGLFDLQQHTYSHQRLKTVVRDDGKAITVFKGASLEKIREEVEGTNQIFKEKLGHACTGITGPYGYYRGLMDRPDILEILYKAGIRFTRTYLRNEKDYGPLSIHVQPFTYELQGFPEILEIPAQGWMDIMYLRAYGWNREAFLNYGTEIIDTIVEQNLTWNMCQHDYTACCDDPSMDFTKRLLSYAQSKGVTITSHSDYMRRRLMARV